MCGAATHRLSRSLTATPGAARRPARTVSAWAAHRPRAAWASSRSPCTVTDRTRLRPDTRSGPSAIRNSHTPGRRCRSDPEPRALFVMLDRRHGSATLGPRRIEGYWDSYWDGRRGALPEATGLAGVCARHGRYQASAPEGIRTPNLLIRSQMLYPLSYGRNDLQLWLGLPGRAAEAPGFEPGMGGYPKPH